MPKKADTDTSEKRSHPVMLRMSDAEIAALEALEDELIAARHPALDVLGGTVTRSDLLRLCIHRGMRELRAEALRG